MNDQKPQTDEKPAGAASVLSAGLGITVYVVESGEYEQRIICGVFSSLDSACASIRHPYVEPYIVKWEDAAKPYVRGKYTYTGHFTCVPGHCGEGSITWVITRYVVDTIE